MTYKVPPIDPDAPAIVMDIGNTSIKLAVWKASQLHVPLSVDADDKSRFRELFDECVKAADVRGGPVIAATSVSPESLTLVQDEVSSKLDRNVLVVGDAIPLPLDVGVDDVASLGVDRVCAAAAAYERLQTECVVVDFGTAITVDVVDDAGVFLGGAILPGIALQLRALHDYTAALPLVSSAFPDHPYGRNTEESIRNGVCRGATGAVRCLLETYATFLNRWPQVVATGGDLEWLMQHCDYIDTAVPNLVLRGVGVALSGHLKELGV